MVYSATATAEDIEVFMVRDNVIAVGDSDANDLEIRNVDSTLHQFRGLNGTTVTGSTKLVVLPVRDDLKIWMLVSRIQ